MRPFDEFDGVVEQLPFAVAGLEDADDVGVRQFGQGGGLAAQGTPGMLARIVPRQDGFEETSRLRTVCLARYCTTPAVVRPRSSRTS